MAITFGSISFDGHTGQIQKPKAKIDYYTRMGDNKIYAQKVNTSSKESSVQLWRVLGSYELAQAHVDSVIAQVGKQNAFTDSHGKKYDSSYIVDMDYTIEAKAGTQWLITYNITMVVDERTN